ncbi:uncharacterized protein LOC116346793 [Contarinia nasturtii]|uniref:uncharacterized protein LOC116346793 n=1 Tax=Contarinia nasturtii TaxID=265458 RepID=UPI0012D44A41|nr:uncharacterized protein LOC116346793 [Contarinia nasturtii]
MVFIMATMMDAHKMCIEAASEPEAIAGPSNQPSSSSSTGDQKPKIFKLNGDCFGEIFEYLQLIDLYRFGQTCKKMQQVAGAYFRQNYATTAFSASLMKGFNRFKTQLSIKRTVGDIQTCSHEFESINYICLDNIQIGKDEVNCLKNLLSKVVTLEVIDCIMEDDFHNLLMYCTNLKRLLIKNSVLGAEYGLNYVPDNDGYDSEKYDSDAEFVPKNKYLWLLQNYPGLEYLYLMNDLNDYPELNRFNGFFDRHPNIRTLSTDYRFICENRTELLNSCATIDTLKLKVAIDKSHLNLHWDAIEKLYARGFFKRLHLSVKGVNQGLIDKIATWQFVEKLTISYLRNLKSIKWCPLPSITELVTVGSRSVSPFLLHIESKFSTKFEIFPNIFENIERLYLEYVTTKDILPFIRQSRKLNKMKLHLIRNPNLQQNAPAPKFGRNNRVKVENRPKPIVLNLQQLNNERKQLAGARKVIIYVNDYIFLATKWATHNGDTDLSLIEVRRTESYEWNR